MVDLNEELKRVLLGIYGGPSIPCWLGGLKHFLVCRGIFSTDVNFFGYEVSPSCREFIGLAARAAEARPASAALRG
jgi:hypothetical protein